MRFNGRTRGSLISRKPGSKTMFLCPNRTRSHLPGLSDRPEAKYSSLLSFFILPYYSLSIPVLSTGMLLQYRFLLPTMTKLSFFHKEVLLARFLIGEIKG